MEIHHTVAGLRSALAGGPPPVFVPTMGSIHAGHLALVTTARALGGPVVTSIFVNRLQFAPGEDFDRYPRTLEDDAARLAAAEVDHVFAPDEAEVYPVPQTYHVAPDPAQADILEGEFRPGFFRGVTTVVAKLLNIVGPRAAVFGKKDYQQLGIVRNMVAQLAMPVDIVACETVRDPDGLALSSRNAYLSPAERKEAPTLSATLGAVREAILAGDTDYAGLQARALETLEGRGWTCQYVAVRRRADVQAPGPGDSLVVLGAAILGSTRLIDNVEV